MLDRVLTRRIANAVANGGRFTSSNGAAATVLPGDLTAICDDARRRVVAYTGLTPATALPPAEAVERSAWIAANVESMGAMLDPLGDRVTGGLGVLRGPLRSAAGALISAEAGALTGYLSQRVLGQYEFVLIDPASHPRLLFVAPNIGLAAERLDADLEELLTWIAFHEVTHAVQFAGVPWLRPHVAGLLRELMASLEVDLDPRALLHMPVVRDVRERVDALREGGLVAALAGPGRRELLDRMQCVMAVIEGHAEHVMDVVGEPALPSLTELRLALDRRRRERSPLLALLERLIGLDAKLRQYEMGKAFCDGIVSAGGPAALHRVFEGPHQLPTLDELKDPVAWLDRVRARAAPPSA
ncbi:MAG: zinc-dependent metalloprotease [Actinomycetota bacterium]|nr:zinc-dependent metalloprotease [Actinomycetota bacterium]